MPNEQDELRKNLLIQVAEAAEALQTSEGWMQRLALARKFHHLSPMNQLLVAIQDPEATYTKTFKGWLTLGRCVRKGEKSRIRIFQPRPFKVEAKKESEEDRFGVGFKLIAQFDIRQTDLLENFDGPVFEPPAWPPIEQSVQGLWSRLVDVAGRNGITVERIQHKPGALGWYQHSARTITVVQPDTLDCEEALGQEQATLLHEMGHAFDPEIEKAYTEAYPRPAAELVAESVAYLVGQAVGLDTSPVATFYLASWRADGKSMAALMDKVIRIANGIEAQLIPVETEGDIEQGEAA